MSEPTCTTRLSRHDADAVFELLCEEFERSPDFGTVGSAWREDLRWSEVDDYSEVLGIFDNGSLVATMRADIIRDSTEASRYFRGYALPSDLQEWPAAALRMAATARHLQGRGLNSVLRYHLIRTALTAGAARLFGYVVIGGSRTNLMASLGYQFLPRVEGNAEYPSTLPWAVTYLDLKANGRRALEQLETLTATERRRYSWTGTRLEGLKSGPEPS